MIVGILRLSRVDATWPLTVRTMRHGNDKGDTRAGVHEGTGAVAEVGGDTSSRIEG